MTTTYATWWVRLWGIVAAALCAAIFFLPYRWWALATAILFGSMEGVGVFGPDRAKYPPLTDVIHRYIPYWLALAGIGVFWGAALSTWARLPHPVMITVMVGLLLWFIAHFTAKYETR